MKAFHQAASVLSQCFDRILNLTAIIQLAYLFNGFLVTVRIFQVLNQIIRMTASPPAMSVLYPLDFHFANGYNLYHDMNF